MQVVEGEVEEQQELLESLARAGQELQARGGGGREEAMEAIQDRSRH